MANVVEARKHVNGKNTRLATKSGRGGKPGHVGVSTVLITSIYPSPENDKLYRPIHACDPAVRALADSIRDHGIREPIVITLDRFILSGHRRHFAARMARLKMVPVRVEPIHRADDLDRFVVMLREYNRQRDKTNTEKLREELVTANPEEARAELLAHRRQASRVDVEAMDIEGRTLRCRISDAKRPMADAVLKVIENNREF